MNNPRFDNPMAAALAALADSAALADAAFALTSTPGAVGGVRAEQWRRLEAALAAARAGSARVVELAGEPGSGKTRLLNELSATATRAGVRVLTGRCTEQDRDLLLHLLSVLPAVAVGAEDVPAFPPPARDPVAEHGPGRSPDLGAASLAQPGGSDIATRLSAARAALSRHTRVPLVLILDDFHWAGEDSVEIVDHLLRWPLDAPLLLVVAHRPAQSGARLRSSLAHCAELGTAERIELRPLTLAEAVRMLGLPAADDVLRTLHETSAGNPHVLAMLAEMDRTPMPGGLALPQDGLFNQFTARVLGETALLDAWEQAVLDAAIVLGAQAGPDYLAAVSGLDYDAACVAVAGLVCRDLLRPAAGSNRFGLRHALLRRALYPRLSPWWREPAHRRAAAFLAERNAPAAEQAAQLELCGDLSAPKDLQVLIQAAAECVRTEPRMAVHWCRVALRSLEQSDAAADRRAEVMLLLARTLGGCGRLQESRDLLHEILRLVPEPVHIRALAASLCAVVEYLLGHRPEARALLAAEAEHAESYPRRDSARLLIEHALLCIGGQAQLGPGRLAEVYASVARGGVDRVTEAGALVLRALDDVLGGRYAESDVSIEVCQAKIDSLSDPALADNLFYISALAWAELYTARFADAERHFRRAIAIAESSGNLVVIPMFLNGLLYVDLYVGPLDIVDTENWGGESLAAGPASTVRTVTLALESMHALWTDVEDDTRGLRLAEESYSAFPDAAGVCGRASSILATASANALDGDVSRCMALLLTSGGGTGLPNLPEVLRPMSFELLTYAAAAAGNSTAEDWSARAWTAAEAWPMPHQRGYALAARAHVARRRGEYRAAAETYTRAADLFGTVTMARTRARILLLAAACLAEAGELGQADAAYRLAEELGRDCGAVRLSHDARRMRGRLAEHRPAEPDRTEIKRKLSALTNREREIAIAASTGRKTREIAADLHLSPRTVDVHLTRIYRKLDLTSRAALAKLITEMELRVAV